MRSNIIPKFCFQTILRHNPPLCCPSASVDSGLIPLSRLSGRPQSSGMAGPELFLLVRTTSLDLHHGLNSNVSFLHKCKRVSSLYICCHQMCERTKTKCLDPSLSPDRVSIGSGVREGMALITELKGCT